MQAQELVQLQAYQEGRLAEALEEVYLHIDQMLASEATRAELAALAGPKDQRTSNRCECACVCVCACVHARARAQKSQVAWRASSCCPFMFMVYSALLSACGSCTIKTGQPDVWSF